MIDDWEFFYNGWFDDTNTLDTVESEDKYFDTTNTLSDGEHSCDSKTTAKKAIKSHQNYVIMVLQTTTYFQTIVEDA